MVSAFQDSYTSSHGSTSFIVETPSFGSQLAELAAILARSLPEKDRTAFIQSWTLPAPSEDADSSSTTQEQASKLSDFVALFPNAKPLESTDRELEGFSNLVLALVLSLSPSSDLPAHISSLVALLQRPAVSPTGRALPPSLQARYTALATIFNALPEEQKQAKLDTLLALVAFAAKHDDAHLLLPLVASLPARLAGLGFTPSTGGEAALLSTVQALKTNGKSAQARSLLLDVLAPKSAEPNSKLANELVGLTLALPDTFDFSPLAKLSSQPEDATLAQLLAIFANGESAAALAKVDAGNLSQWGLTKEGLEKKLRLLALTRTCADKVGGQVGYEELKKALDLEAASKGGEEDDEIVESWVIDAIRVSLISGRLSQPTRTLHVSRATPSQFGPAEWAILGDRLKGWKQGLDALRSSLGSTVGGQVIGQPQ